MMKNIISNTWSIFKKNKEVFYLITVQPVVIFLLMSFLLPYTTTHNIGVVNRCVMESGQNIEHALQKLDGVKVLDVKEDEIGEKILGGNIELAVVIHEDQNQDGLPDVQIVGKGNSEVQGTVELCIKQAASKNAPAKTTVNKVRKKGMTVANSLGFMIFKTLTSGNLLAALIIEERNRKMKDRIMLSGIKMGSYLGGKALVYLLLMMVGSIVYYLAGLLFNFDFGMKYSIGFLLVVFTANVLSICLYLFASTILKKEDSLWFMASFVLLPMALFSGVLFPYQFMPKPMQVIGACCPQRWIAKGIERIQETGSIMAGVPQMLMVLALSAAFFAIAAFRSRPVRVKE